MRSIDSSCPRATNESEASLQADLPERNAPNTTQTFDTSSAQVNVESNPGAQQALGPLFQFLTALFTLKHGEQ